MKSQTLNNTQLSLFFRQMAMVLQSGLPAMEGLSLMKSSPHRALETDTIDKLYDELLMGSYLWQAMKKSHCFPSYAVSMMQLGEDTGHAADISAGLADFYEKEESLRQSLRGAVTYPLVMLTLMVGVLLLMITQVLPVFRQIFRQLGSEMGGVSGAMASTGSLLSKNGVFIALFLVILLLIVLGIAFIPSAAGMRRSVIGRIAPLRALEYDMALSRVAQGLSLMLMSGFSIDQSIEQAVSLTDHPDILSRSAALRESLEQGMPLAEACKDSKLFDDVSLSLILFGVTTGQLDRSMRQIADSHQTAVDQSIARLIGMLEPTLVIIICVITGILLLSVMLPLAGILSGLAV